MAKRDNDIEEEVAGYHSRMSQLARILSRHTARGLNALKADLRAMMDRGFYDPRSTSIFLNSMADSATILRLDELVRLAPEGMRERAWKDIIDTIANGRMTNRRAVRYLSRFNLLSVVDGMLTTSARILDKVTVDGYLHGAFMLQKSAGFGWGIDGLKDARMQIIVHSAFSESDARRFVSVAADMADEKVLYEMLKGSTPEQVERSVDYAKDASVYRSKRMARTLITETASQAHHEVYREHKVRAYTFRCTYDERTCPVCGNLDGKDFPVDKAMPGTNYPPIHPNCRCTTVAAFSKEIEDAMAPRVMRDRSTGRIVEVGQDFTYREWYDTFGPGRKDGLEYIPKKR